MDSIPPNENNWPYAVASRIVITDKNGKQKETDHLDYCISSEHAMAIAHQSLAAGRVGVIVIDLNQKV